MNSSSENYPDSALFYDEDVNCHLVEIDVGFNKAEQAVLLHYYNLLIKSIGPPPENCRGVAVRDNKMFWVVKGEKAAPRPAFRDMYGRILETDR